MPSVTSSFTNIITSVLGIFASLFNSVLAVLQTIVALGLDAVNGALTMAQHLVGMVLELFQGAVGFVTTNIVAIVVIVAGYYVYSGYSGRRVTRN